MIIRLLRKKNSFYYFAQAINLTEVRHDMPHLSHSQHSGSSPSSHNQHHGHHDQQHGPRHDHHYNQQCHRHQGGHRWQC
jgi:hypothetical protein